MNMLRNTALALAIATLPLLVACSNQNDTNTATETTSALGGLMEKASEEVRESMATENITISEDDSQTKAEITPQGDLLIDGRKVAIDASQRALLLEYRAHVAGLVQAGMQIGMQGADLASKAIGEAFRSILSGNEAAMEQRIEAEAEEIEAQALQLCEQLPAMLATQQALAASLPEFAPYATMTQDDIDDCLEEGHFSTR